MKRAEEEKEEVETEEEEYVHVASASRSCDLGVPAKTKVSSFLCVLMVFLANTSKIYLHTHVFVLCVILGEESVS